MADSPLSQLRALRDHPTDQFGLALRLVAKERNVDTVIAAAAVLEAAADERARAVLLARYDELDQNGALVPTTYATYHGGVGDDWCCRVEMDQQLRATVAGYSDSTTLPAVGSGSYQPTNAGLRDAFVVRFAPFGTSYLYATFLGGALNEGFLSNPFNLDSRGLGLDVDAAGRVLVVGLTPSANFPVTPTTALHSSSPPTRVCRLQAYRRWRAMPRSRSPRAPRWSSPVCSI